LSEKARMKKPTSGLPMKLLKAKMSSLLLFLTAIAFLLHTLIFHHPTCF